MIFGHLGIAAAVRSTQRNAGGTPALFALAAAAGMPDLVDTFYYVASICNPYGLYSHTIPAVLLQAAVVGGIALLITDSWLTAAAFFGVVVLHLVADLPTMRKLIWPGGEFAGLDFYRTPKLDALVEIPTIAAGWWLLRRSGHGPRWAVTIPVLAMVLCLQMGLDAFMLGTMRPIKPNACPVVSPVSGNALLPQ